MLLIAPLGIAIFPEGQEQQGSHHQAPNVDTQDLVIAVIGIKAPAEDRGPDTDADRERGEDEAVERAERAAAEIAAHEKAEHVDLGADREADADGGEERGGV